MPLSLLLSAVLEHPTSPDIHEALHAAVLAALSRHSPVLARETHDTQINPFSLQFRRDEHGVRLRVHTFREDIGVALQQAWASGNLLGESDGHILQARITGFSSSRWEYAEMLERWADVRSAPSVTVSFLTPTAFKHDDRAVRWPSPHLLFGGLMRRWTIFGPRLPQKLDPFDVRLMRLDTRDARIVLHRDQRRVGIPAFTGRATFQLSGSAIQTAGATLEFGTRAGLGTLTAYGFGEIEMSRSGQQ